MKRTPPAVIPPNSVPTAARRTATICAQTAGLVLIAFLGFQPTFARAHPPTGIVVDEEGSVFFLKFLLGTDEERERSQLWKLDPDGTLTNIPVTLAGRKLSRPHKLAIDSKDGTVYIMAAEGLVKVSPDGAVSKLDFIKEPPPFWDSPLAVDRQGNLYYYSIGGRSERGQNLSQLVKMDAGGDVHIVAGSTEGHKDGTSEDAQFVNIQAIAAGRSGDLYVADGDGKTGSWIRRVTSEGAVTTIAGSRRVGFADGEGGAARFRSLGGLSVDEKGNLYVADPFNNRIRQVTQDGVVTTFAGSGVYGDTDGPAGEASLAHPTGVAVGPKGNVYVLDGAAKIARVRKISLDGKVETLAVVRRLRSGEGEGKRIDSRAAEDEAKREPHRREQSVSCEEHAARLLFRVERTRIDGTEPPTTWPEKVRRIGSAWIADVDTSRLPGGYPEQFVLQMTGTGGHTGNPERPEARWGEPMQGIAARLIVKKQRLAPDDPIRATLELKKAGEAANLPDAVNLSSLSLHYHAVGDEMDRGGMAFLPVEGKAVPVKHSGTAGVFFEKEFDLVQSAGFVPRINTDYEIQIGYHVGYEGSRSIKAYSRPARIRVHVPEEKILDYYITELLAERPRELRRQEGDNPIPYPNNELVKLGKPALKKLNQLAQAETDPEPFDRAVLSLSYFGEAGAEALSDIAAAQTGRLKTLAERYLEMAQRRADFRQPESEAEVRQIPVTVIAQVKPIAVQPGEPIPLSVTITNGLKGPITFSTYSLQSNGWNGETVHLSPVDIFRDGGPPNLFLERPKVDPPPQVAGMAGHRIGPGESLTITTDARKWKIADGWKPGKYRITVRAENLSADGGRCLLSVQSDPIEVEIR